MRFVLAFVSILLLAGFALAELPLLSDVVTLDMNLRPRYEVDGRDFNSDTGMSDYGTMRTMVGINVMPNENLLIRVKFKESRHLGTQLSNNRTTSSFDAQEAYFKLKNVFDRPIMVKAGRFEYKLGRNRIFGPGGWNIYGPRSYDGMKVHFDTIMGDWSLLLAKVTDYDAAHVNLANNVYGTANQSSKSDRNLIVLSGKLFEDHFQPLFSADMNNNEPATQEDADILYTAGFFYKRMLGDNFKFMMDGAYQFGKKADRDVASYLVAADVYYMLGGEKNWYIGAGADMTSGNKWDEDSPVDDDNVFYAPFMSRHVYRGYMDYFQDVRRGMIDAIFHVGFKPENGVSVMVDVHSFMFANDAAYVDTNGQVVEYTQVGQEIDVRSIIPVNENVNLDCGASAFMPTDDWVMDGDMALWFYLAAVVSF
ncbi:alginate export family protein [bacterium]|nr:alginate export family protein [bacterium]